MAGKLLLLNVIEDAAPPLARPSYVATNGKIAFTLLLPHIFGKKGIVKRKTRLVAFVPTLLVLPHTCCDAATTVPLQAFLILARLVLDIIELGAQLWPCASCT